MSYTSIDSKVLSMRADMYRKSSAKNSWGGISESWILVNENVPIVIQHRESSQKSEESGEHVKRSDTAYLSDSEVVIFEGDRLVSLTDGLVYRISSVLPKRNSSGSIHHIQLSLEAYRQDFTRTFSKSISSKAYIDGN